MLTDVKASNQQAQFLGNKVEMAITKAVENNKSLLRVGLHFEFNDCRLVMNVIPAVCPVRFRTINYTISYIYYYTISEIG